MKYFCESHNLINIISKKDTQEIAVWIQKCMLVLMFPNNNVS